MTKNCPEISEVCGYIPCIKKMMDVKIQRHVKVKSCANPYLPEYKEYFEARKKWTKDCSLIQWKLDKKLNVIMDENLLGDQP